MEAVLKIMAQKSACQDSDEDVDEDDDQVQVFYLRLNCSLIHVDFTCFLKTISFNKLN